MMCIFWDCHLTCLLGQVADGLSGILSLTETNDWIVFSSKVFISKERKQNKTESFVSKGLVRLSGDAIRALSPAKAITSYSTKQKWK